MGEEWGWGIGVLKVVCMTLSKGCTNGTYELRACLPSHTAADVVASMMETDTKTNKQNRWINLQK